MLAKSQVASKSLMVSCLHSTRLDVDDALEHASFFRTKYPKGYLKEKKSLSRLNTVIERAQI